MKFIEALVEALVGWLNDMAEEHSAEIRTAALLVILSTPPLGTAWVLQDWAWPVNTFTAA